MLKYGNREFRNLQEQVYANMKNIEDIIREQPILATYTIKIVAAVDDVSELPDADTYEGDYGDIYVVGTESPYNLYVFGKDYENEAAPTWIDLGACWVQGPQGPQGATGPTGPAGPTPRITNYTSTNTLEPGQNASVSIIKGGTDAQPSFSWTFNIPRGAAGPQGPKGDTGIGVPAITSGDAGKVLIVNQAETNAVWGPVTLTGEVEESNVDPETLSPTAKSPTFLWYNDTLYALIDDGYQGA